MYIHDWLCRSEHWLLCKNINQPHTGGYAKDVLPIVELLTSHLKKKSKQSIPHCAIFLSIHLYKNDFGGA